MQWFFGSEEGEDCAIGRKCLGFSGCERNSVDRLSSQILNSLWDYYSKLLNKLDLKFVKTDPNYRKKCFLENNVPTHKSFLVIRKLSDLHCEVQEHTPYSLDSAP